MRRCAAYSLVEVLVASAILVGVLAGAAAMAMSVSTQVEGNARLMRAWNHQEQAARLYQLGLDPDKCLELLPSEPVVPDGSLTCVTGEETIDGVGDVEYAVWTMNVTASTFTFAAPSGDRSRSITSYRPTIR